MSEKIYQTEVTPKGDFGLTPEQLEAKHGKEHNNHTRDEWRDEVGNRDTQLGYWDWVLHQVESHYSGDCDQCGKRDRDKMFANSELICQECASAEFTNEAKARDS